MKDGLCAIYERRSVRKYKPEQITDGELELVLKAGLCAPSAMNRQSAIIVVLQNRDDISHLSKLNAAVMGTNSDPFYGAPTVLVVLAETGNANAVKDGSLVMGNLMNAASAIGLGSFWINRSEEVFAGADGKALLKKWGVEGDYTGIGHCILGYADEQPEMKPVKGKRVYFVR